MKTKSVTLEITQTQNVMTAPAKGHRLTDDMHLSTRFLEENNYYLPSALSQEYNTP